MSIHFTKRVEWLIMDTAHGNTQYPDDPSLTWSSGATTVTLQ